jgi:hypothetical protein
LQRNQIAAVSALENKLSVRLSHLFAASALPCLKLEQITPFKNQVLKHPFIFIPNTLFTALLNCALTFEAKPSWGISTATLSTENKCN